MDYLVLTVISFFGIIFTLIFLANSYSNSAELKRQSDNIEKLGEERSKENVES